MYKKIVKNVYFLFFSKNISLKISLGEIKCAQISSLGGYSAIFECIVAAYYVEIINVVVKRKQVRFCAINLN